MTMIDSMSRKCGPSSAKCEECGGSYSTNPPEICKCKRLEEDIREAFPTSLYLRLVGYAVKDRLPEHGSRVMVRTADRLALADFTVDPTGSSRFDDVEDDGPYPMEGVLEWFGHDMLKR